jgi:hypothetical protein
MATKIDPKLQAQIDALTQSFMTARGGGEDFNVAMPNLSPELLDFILKSETQQDSGGYGLLRGISDPSGSGFMQQGNYAMLGNNPESQAYSTDPSRVDWSQSPLRFSVNSDTSNYTATYGPDGRFQGYELMQDDSNYRDAIIAAMMMAPAVAGVYGAAGAAGEGGAAGAGGGAGGSGGAGLSGMDLAADAALGTGNNITTAGAGMSGASGLSGMDLAADAGMNSVNSAGGTTWGTGQTAATTGTSAATKAGGAATAGTTAATGGGTSAGTAATTATAGKGLLDIFTADGSLDYAKLATGLLGAYTGYQGGKDQQQTQSRDPWGPAQPYLKGLLSEGAELYGQQKAEPFSQAEQTAYGNQGNILDFINGNAPGLMDGFVANASGQNQFQRGKQKSLIGSSYNPATSPVTWQPGLLGNFGTGRK